MQTPGFAKQGRVEERKVGEKILCALNDCSCAGGGWGQKEEQQHTWLGSQDIKGQD